MKVSFHWLQEFVPIDRSPTEVAALLVQHGFEVVSHAAAGGPVTGVVVALVEAVDKHPNADKLKLCRVFDGATRQVVVCGAPNVEAGRRYPLARVGARLPDGLIIEKRSLRGVESRGMLCSDRELGIGDNHEGLFLLPEEAPLGEEIAQTLDLNDVIFEIEVTPNRPDVLSHWGVARELAAGLGKKGRGPDLEISDAPHTTGLARVEEPGLCSLYVARVLEDLRVGPSPLWMRLRLERCGIRSINNLVDVTNYVLLEWGHPLHVFDRSKLSGGGVTVRFGRAGESLACLDGVTRDVSGSLVIADANGPVAAAGVMGGQPTAVQNNTHEVLLESAHFLPAQVRRDRSRLGLSTESSFRFERGTDPHLADQASRRAVQLFGQLAGGRCTAEEIWGKDDGPVRSIRVSLDRLSTLLGVPVTSAEAQTALESLDFSCTQEGPVLTVTPPIHRADVRDTADVLEEVARRTGYDRIPARVRAATSAGDLPSPVRMLARLASDRLVALGFWEVASSGLVPRTLWDQLSGAGAEEPVELANPLSITGECLNPSLLVNLLACLAGNVRRGNGNVRLFEAARVFHREGKGVGEADHLAWVATGLTNAEHWLRHPRAMDIWDAKAWVHALLRVWRLTDVTFRPGEVPFLHPAESQSLWVGDQRVGVYGRLHPRQAERLEISPDTFLGELNLTSLAGRPRAERRFSGLSRQPALVRDFSLVFPEKVSWASIVDWIHRECAGVERVELFDVFTGRDLPIGTRSLAFRVSVRHLDRTLSEAEAQVLQDQVLQGLAKAHGAQARNSTTP